MKNTMMLTAISLATLFAACNSNKTEETDRKTETTQGAVMDSVTANMEADAVSINTDAVPMPMKTTFEKKHPGVKDVEWTKYTPSEDDDMDVNNEYYFVRFNNDGKDYIDWYNTKGDWVKTATIVKDNSGLPAPVSTYLNNNYTGYTVEEISKENDKDMEMYKIKLTKGDNKVKLKILPNGQIFKKKSK